ncbi:C4-dicarboxylate ABC transporter substrate-binding protein [Kineobactrum sediminis]|uniref:C4-dicarboxylate ABC transporter substrate-binding protein n=1 Tax=Kineobactrum sediminis TaxID=1905677 RepID=A0A2N5Y0Y3_9GAMM|nr:C4-dicarboxylate ABC transporter substrate-binding protein [Kineobactrum sediminis]PLW82054.1 C4-dicarboxylate ABC transporter substrate-binding protein [Kineobactrum sediminis]
MLRGLNNIKAFRLRLLVLTAVTFISCLSQASDQPKSKTLLISAGIPKVHFWVGAHMDEFADSLESQSNDKLKFIRYYGGELVGPGRELDALNGYLIDVAAPLLAPYHEGKFPLSDITQLPTYQTNSLQITKAFQALLDSKIEISEGKTFYDLEIRSQGLVAWPLGATEAYVIATSGKEITRPEDLRGMPMRAGSALQMLTIENLGATPVYLPSSQAYEALSRGVIDSVVLSIGDWESYSLQGLLKYSITGISLGHWESYLALKEETWDDLAPDLQELWDKVARDISLTNARHISAQDRDVKEKASKTARFVHIKSLPLKLQEFIAKAALSTWIQWIEKLEAQDKPARAAAVLWVNFVEQEGGMVPPGVKEYLGVNENNR